MEELTWKIDLNAICPHCGYDGFYVFYLNANSLICNKCDEKFNIELWVKDIEVKSSK